MRETTVIRLKDDIQLNDPILIVGLPGVGHVGKLVVDHLIEKLEAEKVFEIYSPHFPPQVMVNEESTVKLVNNEIYICKTEERDLVLLGGDHQSTTTDGHYELGGIYIELADELGVSKIYTLGGYPTGKLEHTDEVMGAANDIELIEELKELGVTFKPNEPGGGIVGASGLLLGLSKFKDMKAACLMGLTSGYLVDPKSAQSLLAILSKLLNIEVEVSELEERAKDMEKIVANLMEAKQQQQGVLRDTPIEEDLRYIG
ncbi:proteasome assembly chaperone family protein [Methanococcoides methylutens]|uniref:proteasome assembly chaperone family protein n=1 Tax=Methanococcoides methylutens TaxID=2226 RepID=UPI004044FBF6